MAGQALIDLAEETGAPSKMVEWAQYQLMWFGIWLTPFEDEDEQPAA